MVGVLLCALLVQYMSGSILQYKVEDSKDYYVAEGGVGKLHEKSSAGFKLHTLTEEFALALKLNAPGIVTIIDVHPYNLKILIIELLGKDGQPHEVQTFHFNSANHNSAQLIDFPASKSNRTPTHRINVKAYTDNPEDATGIRYLIVKGDKPEKEDKRPRVNISKRPENFEVRDPPPRNKGADMVFKDRQRNKDKEDKPRPKPKQMTEEEQLKVAMELSRQEAVDRGHHFEESSDWHPRKDQRKGKPEGRSVERERARAAEEQDKRNWQAYERERERDFHLVEFEKVKRYFENVNSNWLEAQRKAETEKGVDERHRLSRHIQVRHFYNKTICFDVPAARRANLEKLAVGMGAKVVAEVADNCLLVSGNRDSEKVARARKCRNVKVVLPEFIEECKQCDAYLDERTYFLKL